MFNFTKSFKVFCTCFLMVEIVAPYAIRSEARDDYLGIGLFHFSKGVYQIDVSELLYPFEPSIVLSLLTKAKENIELDPDKFDKFGDFVRILDVVSLEEIVDSLRERKGIFFTFDGLIADL